MKYFTIFTLLFFLSCGDDSTEPTQLLPVLSISPVSQSISVGENAQISLQIENMQTAIFGISLRISFDSSIISFTAGGITAGDFFGENIVSIAQSEESVLYLSVTLTQGESAVSGSGEIGILTLVGETTGNSSIVILPDELRFFDSSGNEITISDVEFEETEIVVE